MKKIVPNSSMIPLTIQMSFGMIIFNKPYKWALFEIHTCYLKELFSYHKFLLNTFEIKYTRSTTILNNILDYEEKPL